MEPAVLMLTFSTSPLPVTGTPVSRFSVLTMALGSRIKEESTAASSTVRFWRVPEAIRRDDSGVLFVTFSRLPDSENSFMGEPSSVIFSSPRPVGVLS